MQNKSDLYKGGNVKQSEFDDQFDKMLVDLVLMRKRSCYSKNWPLDVAFENHELHTVFGLNFRSCASKATHLLSTGWLYLGSVRKMVISTEKGNNWLKKTKKSIACTKLWIRQE